MNSSVYIVLQRHIACDKKQSSQTEIKLNTYTIGRKAILEVKNGIMSLYSTNLTNQV